MKRLVWLSIVPLLLGAIPASRGIDFELKEQRYKDLDGVGIDLYFPHESNRVFYRPPPGWRYEGSKSKFTAQAPAGVSGVMLLETEKPLSRVPPPGTNTPEALDAYEKVALSFFNLRGQEPKVVERSAEAMGGRALPTTRIVIEYMDQVLARRYTICYVQFRPEIWITVKIDSLKQDAKIHREALHSLEGFTEVTPEPPQPQPPG